MNFERAIGMRVKPLSLRFPDKSTSLGFAVRRVRPLSALTPAPLPRGGRGEPRADLFGVLKLTLQRGRKLRFRTPQSPSPARRERGTMGVRATRRAHPFTPTRGKSPLPQRFCAEPMYPYHTNRAAKVHKNEYAR